MYIEFDFHILAVSQLYTLFEVGMNVYSDRSLDINMATLYIDFYGAL